MYCYCKDEFDWLMKMIEKGDCFFYWKDIGEFIDDDLFELRYMKKRFGYLFQDHYKYIKKVNGRNAIFVEKEDGFVCRKPEEPHYHGVNIDEPQFNPDGTTNENYYLNVTIPMEDTKRYEIKYLDEIDRGEPYLTNEDKKQDKEIKKN